jgi:hypothetical protein
LKEFCPTTTKVKIISKKGAISTEKRKGKGRVKGRRRRRRQWNPKALTFTRPLDPH